MRDGDLEIYTMDADGKNVQRLTNELGYDGGAFFSARRQADRLSRLPSDRRPNEIERYKELLAEGLIEPTALELWVMNADGTNKRQVTQLGAASFAPYFYPDGKRIIFASNVNRPEGPQLRPLPRQHGRHRSRAHHLQRNLRRLPDVLARRQAAGLRFEPQRGR